MLGSARFRTFVAMELGASFEDVNALVAGAMVTLWYQC